MCLQSSTCHCRLQGHVLSEREALPFHLGPCQGTRLISGHSQSETAVSHQLAIEIEITLAITRGKQHSQPVGPCSAHSPPFGKSPSPFFRNSHALFTSATTAGELFLFGGFVHKSKSPSSVHVILFEPCSNPACRT